MGNIIKNIKVSFQKSKGKRLVRQWAERTDDCHYGKYYVKRRFEENEIFYDLYWYVYRSAAGHHVESIYQRCHKAHVDKAIHDIEKHDLMHLFRKLDKEIQEK